MTFGIKFCNLRQTEWALDARASRWNAVHRRLTSISLIYNLIEWKVESRSTHPLEHTRSAQQTANRLNGRRWSSKRKLCRVHVAASQTQHRNGMISTFCRWNLQCAGAVAAAGFARLVGCIYVRKLIFRKLLIGKMYQKQSTASLYFFSSTFKLCWAYIYGPAA